MVIRQKLEKGACFEEEIRSSRQVLSCSSRRDPPVKEMALLLKQMTPDQFPML
jgi:hypothetical protein